MKVSKSNSVNGQGAACGNHRDPVSGRISGLCAGLPGLAPKCAARTWGTRQLVIAFLFLCCLMGSTWLHASAIAGTVKDPTGAVIVDARIEITGGDLVAPVVFASGATGKFTSPELKPGKYFLRVTKDGFEPQVQGVELSDTTDLQVTLAVGKQQFSISVPGVRSSFANSDPMYRALRQVGLGESYRVDNINLDWDTATFQFQKGTLTFLSPVDGVVTGAIFSGEGHFKLKAVTRLDAHELDRRIGTAEPDVEYTDIVFRFTPDASEKLHSILKDRVDTPGDAASVFNHWKEKMRQRHEEAMSFTQYLLEGEAMDNVDADLLAVVYNHEHPAFFNAYIHGKKYKDLRYFVRMRVGALPQIDSPEAVALINNDVGGMNDGIWYLSHTKAEYMKGTATSLQDRRLFDTRHYKIETTIAKNVHLYASATITFVPLVNGERVLKFGLLPNLRVSRVLDEQGQNLYFIQEGRKEDGSFYAILSKAPQVGHESKITIEYAGDKVIQKAGEGSFYVGARTDWYPNLNGIADRATYDLTYKVPRRFKVVSVGKIQSESVEQDMAVSRWVTSSPVMVAGFNYGDYKKIDMPDEKTGYSISGYYLTELPDMLRGNPAVASMAPGSMAKYALDQTRVQLQLCNFYFGKSSYNDIYITEQPDFNFGQSWPNLIYLPISAYIDSTQRYMLFGQIDNKFTGFVQEVTPHEVAHQWWGHTVGWASYHDQWLSEGFADFSAALFLQHTTKDWKKEYVEYWERLRRRILEKNQYGVAPNDAGPLWMGLRLMAPRSANAYQNLTYPKGAYVLQMLRSIMYSDGDKAFIEMMHDFVETHRDKSASTETFKLVAERHMSKGMDLQGNGRLDWFFNEWVYGTQVPKYQFDYQLTPADGGKVKLHMKLTQSEVDDHFAMLVPVYADFGKGMVRLGQLPIAGNTTTDTDTVLPERPKKIAINSMKDILER